MATIIGMMANNYPWDGDHPWDLLESFDHFGEGTLPRDGDHPKNGDHHRDGGCLRDFYHPKGWLLNFGVGFVESKVSTQNRNLKSVSLSVCLLPSRSLSCLRS